MRWFSYDTRAHVPLQQVRERGTIFRGSKWERIHGAALNAHRESFRFGERLKVPESIALSDRRNIYYIVADHPQVSCYLTHTTAETHRLIRDNLKETPIYGGWVDSKGPRYCPSIEDKIVRFAEKESHQVRDELAKEVGCYEVGAMTRGVRWVITWIVLTASLTAKLVSIGDK